MNTHGNNVIVAGVDGSPSSTAAAMWAADEAQRRQAGLRLVQAYSVSVGFAGPGGMIPTNIFDDVRQWAKTVLTGLADTVRDAYPDLDIDAQLRHDVPFVALREAGSHALMTVVGTHGTSAIMDSLVGSIPVRLASHGPGPVVVIRADSSVTPALNRGPVLVGLDGSADSERALSFAFEEASLRGTPLVALHCWGDRSDSFRLPYPPESRDDAAQEPLLRRVQIAELLSGWSDKYPDVRVQPVTRDGQPGAEILRYCQHGDEADRPAMIVVGSRGHGGFAGLLLGSTSQALIAHSSRPLVIIRGAAES